MLARTRWILFQLRDELMRRGVPFTIKRGPQNPLVTTKGLAYKCCLRLASEGCANSAELKALMKHTGKPWVRHGAKAQVSRLSDAVHGMSSLKDVFGDGFAKAIQVNPALPLNVLPQERVYFNQVFAKGGLEALNRTEDIVLTSIHGSKGGERPTVVVSPELSPRVAEAYMRNKTPEHLCFYVAVTRAIKNLIILVPEGKSVFSIPR